MGMGRLRLLACVSLVACHVPEAHLAPEDADTGTADTLVPTTANYDFGTIVANMPSALAGITITNTADVPSGQIERAILGGPDASQYKLDVDGCVGRILDPGGTCTIMMLGMPTTPGKPQATVSLHATPGGTATIGLTANVVAPGALKFQPTTKDFGSLLPGAPSADVTFTATNTGGARTGT